jgi:hypothetical protein
VQRTLRVAAIVVCAGLAACVVNLSFDMRKSLQAASASGNVVDETVEIDLFEYEEVQQHWDSIESISLDSADARIATVRKGGESVHFAGKLSVRAEGAPADGSQDVLVGNIPAIAVVSGNAVHLTGSPELDQFLLQTLRGSGRFIAVVSGQSNAEMDCDVDLTIRASIAYDAGLF